MRSISAAQRLRSRGDPPAAGGMGVTNSLHPTRATCTSLRADAYARLLQRLNINLSSSLWSGTSRTFHPRSSLHRSGEWSLLTE